MRKYRFIKKIAPAEGPINFLEPLSTCPPVRNFHWPGDLENLNDSPRPNEAVPQNGATASAKISVLN